MKDIENLDDLLDAYLDGYLTEIDRQELEQALTQDPALQRRLELFKAERRAGNLLVRQKIRQQVRAWSAANLPPAQAAMAPAWRTHYLPLAVAATFLLMVVVAPFLPKSVWLKANKIEITSGDAPKQSPTKPDELPADPAPYQPASAPKAILLHSKKAPLGQATAPKNEPQITTPMAGAPSSVSVAPASIDFSELKKALQPRYAGAQKNTAENGSLEDLRIALRHLEQGELAAAALYLEKFCRENPDHVFQPEASRLLREIRASN